tara:strand:+ start:2641 stop:3036 length:396 start_codon:yes stop_codon:yes gene_type:complete
MHHYKAFKGGPLFFGGGAPVIQGGMSQAEMTAMLERQALDNDRMLANAADEAAALQDELARKDDEMSLIMEQQEIRTQQDLAKAQKALGVELDAQQDADEEDDLEADFGKLEAALAAGLGRGTTNTNVRPV